MKGERNIGGDFYAKLLLYYEALFVKRINCPGRAAALPPESRLITGLLPLTDRVAPGRRRRRCRGRAAPLWTCLE